MLTSDLMGPTEVCELLEVRRDTLLKWRRRPAVAFPSPFLELSAMPIWVRADIEKWALSTGRLLEQVSEAF